MGVKRNPGHSAFQRLLNMARTEKQNLNLLLTRYATERLLYRLSISRHKNSFVLKGASMFLVWKGLFGDSFNMFTDLLKIRLNALRGKYR